MLHCNILRARDMKRPGRGRRPGAHEAGPGRGPAGPRRRAQNTDELRAKATMNVAARVAPAVMLSRVAKSEAFFTDMVFLPISQGRRDCRR